MSQFTQFDALINALSELGRRVVTDWRTLIILRRATFALGQGERRWDQLPETRQDIHRLLNQLVRRSQLAPLPEAPYLYRVTLPYAQVLPVTEEEILLEVNPYAVISHASALTRHGLSLDVPNKLWVTTPLQPTNEMIPLDTVSEDWEGLELPIVRRPQFVQHVPIEWTVTKRSEGIFGVVTVRPHGIPYNITSIERTLLDGLIAPEKCGGVSNVLTSWRAAAESSRIDLQSMISLVERFGIKLLAQRAGYLLETLGYADPEIDLWAARAHRGGSSKLIAANEFSDRISERWKLSLNGPIHLIDGADS